MNSRTIQIMAVVAFGLAGAAWFATRSNAPAQASAGQLFPDLAKRTADIQSVKIQGKGQTFTLEKQGQGWGVAEKGGYPVNFDKVKDLVSKVAYFKVLEKKTDNPNRFVDLELEDADQPEAKSTRVTLSDASGTVLADVLIGMSASGGGPNLSSLYVRRAGENQTYEVSGNLFLDSTPTNWLDKQVAKLDRARIHKVETTAADGSKLVISKTAPDDKNFTVHDVPEGKELKWAGVADGVAGALEYLNFDDVQPAGTLDFNDPAAATTTMQTFDGLLVTAKVLEKEGKFYGQFSAKADPAARVEVTKFEPPTVGPEPPVEGADPAEPVAPAQPVETKSVPGKTAEEVAKEAAELDARLSKWTYVLPGYAASNFSKKMTDMLKEPEPALPAFDPNAPPVDPDNPTDGLHDDHQHPVDDGKGGDGQVPPPPPTPPVDDGGGEDGHVPPAPATPPPVDDGGGGGGR